MSFGLGFLNDSTSTASPTLQQFLNAADCQLHDAPAISTNLSGPHSQGSPGYHGAMASSAAPASSSYYAAAGAGSAMQLMQHSAPYQSLHDGHRMPAAGSAAGAANASDGRKGGGGRAGAKGAAKNGRRGVPKSQIICKVDGCQQVLSSSKAYYQRHRVCAAHLAAMAAVVDGVESRFCQQCGKFQPIEEFDADKRSCRTRLKRHNNRRREQRHNKSNDLLSSLHYHSERHHIASAAVADAANLAAAAAAAAAGSGGSSHLSPRTSPQMVGTTAGSSGTPNTAGDEHSSHAWTLSHEATPSPHAHPLQQQAGGAPGAMALPAGMLSHSPSSARRPQMRRSSANRALEALRSLNASSTSTASDFDDDYDDMEEPSAPGAPSRQKKKNASSSAGVRTHQHSQQQQQSAPGHGSPALYGMQPLMGQPAPGLSRFAPFSTGGRTGAAGQQQWDPHLQQQQQATVFGGIAGAAAAAAACFADAGAAAAEGAALLSSMAAQHSAPPLMGHQALARGSSAGSYGDLRGAGTPWEGSCPAAMAGLGDTSSLIPAWSLAGQQQQATAATSAAGGIARQVSSGGQQQQQAGEDGSDYRLSQRQKLQHHEQQQMPVVGDGSCSGAAGARLSYSSAGSGTYHQMDSRAVATFQAEIRRDSQQAAMRVVSSSDELFRQQQQRNREQQQLGLQHHWDVQLQQQQHVDLSRSQSYSNSLPPLQAGHSHSSGGGLVSGAAAAAVAGSAGSGSFLLARRDRSSSPCGHQQLLAGSSGGSGSNGGRAAVSIPGLPNFSPQLPSGLQGRSSTPGLPGQLTEQYNQGSATGRFGAFSQGGGGFMLPGQIGFGGSGAGGQSCSDLTSGLSGSALGTATTSGGGGERWSQQGNQASSGGLGPRAGSMSFTGAAADSPCGSSVLRGDLAGITISTVSSGGTAAAAAAAWEQQQQLQQVGCQEPSIQAEELASAAASGIQVKGEPGITSPFEQQQRQRQGSDGVFADAADATADDAAAGCSAKSWLDNIPSPSPKGGVVVAGLVPSAPLLHHQQQQHPGSLEQQQQQSLLPRLHIDRGLHGGARASAPGCLFPSQATVMAAVVPAAAARSSCGGAVVSAFAAAAGFEPQQCQQSAAADCATAAATVAAAAEQLLGCPRAAAAAVGDDPSPSFAVIAAGVAAPFGGSDVFRGMSGDEDFGELLDLLLESN